MRVLWATFLVLFTLVCLPLAYWLASAVEIAEPAVARAEGGTHELLARLAVLLTGAPATLVAGPLIGWAGYVMKRSWVTWIGAGLVAAHALAVVETFRRLGEVCTNVSACLAG